MRWIGNPWPIVQGHRTGFSPFDAPPCSPLVVDVGCSCRRASIVLGRAISLGWNKAKSKYLASNPCNSLRQNAFRSLFKDTLASISAGRQSGVSR